MSLRARFNGASQRSHVLVDAHHKWPGSSLPNNITGG